MAIYDSILDTIGRTPVVKLHRIAPAHVTLRPTCGSRSRVQPTATRSTRCC